MKKLAAVLIAAALLTGCATVQKVAIDQNVATSMRGKTVARSTRDAKPDFAAMTPSRGAFAMVGAFAAITSGNELVKENNVAVPADAIGQALGEQLQTARGVQLAALPIRITSSEAGEIAAATNGKADYVIDVQTTSWMFVYYPTQWGRYRVAHTAQVRVIDVASKTIVSQGSCFHNPEFSENSPTYDQLVDNQAAGLKKELAIAATECVDSVKHDILAL